MYLTCIECNFVGDYRTHFDIPNEPGNGICKDLNECKRRKKVWDELHERDS